MKSKTVIPFVFLFSCLVHIAFSQPDPPDTSKHAAIIQVMPKFRGDLSKYLGDSIKYPETERKAGIAGTVYVTFVVEKDGSISVVKVLKGVPNGPGLDAEALRVVRAMPAWDPGMQNGKTIRVQFNLPIHFELKDDAPSTENGPVFTIVQQMPKFRGDLMKYLSDSVRYPKAEQAAGITGTVYITFVVNKDGSIADAKVLRGVPNGPGLDEEALRVIKSMPPWIPGTQNGNNVRVQFNIPIHFQLK